MKIRIYRKEPDKSIAVKRTVATDKTHLAAKTVKPVKALKPVSKLRTLKVVGPEDAVKAAGTPKTTKAKKTVHTIKAVNKAVKPALKTARANRSASVVTTAFTAHVQRQTVRRKIKLVTRSL